MIVLATFNIDHFSFFGLRQVWDHVLGRTARTVPFTARFLYGIVRHPISLGWIILFWSTPNMTAGHLLFATCMTVYIAIVTPIEEADLVQALGDDYRRYRGRVGAFIPRRNAER
jgi:protein-S-isoprenylcysteine O-methyltransferase Ste14